MEEDFNAVFNALPQPPGPGRSPRFGHVAMAKINRYQPPKPLRHFRYRHAFPPEPNSGFRTYDFLRQLVVAVAWSIPGKLAPAHDYPNLGPSLLQQGSAFQRGLAGANHRDV